MSSPPTIEEIRDAEERIAPYIHRTPVFTSHALDTITGGYLYFKCENFQKVGAFKFRGACNAIFSLSEEEARSGVATHSSGNHAQAVALAAKLSEIPSYIVMPENAPRVKVAAVRNYGAAITFCEPTLEARESTLESLIAETGAHFVHPYDDFRIIWGQATCALEFFSQTPSLDYLLVPVGGGGLLSGTALTTSSVSPDTRVIAVEPAGADDAYRSFYAGHIFPSLQPDTVADGLLTSLGEKTFPVIQEYVEDIITVEDRKIVTAMRLIWERMKIVVEPSAAVPLAALIDDNPFPQDQQIGLILSGGNVDLDRLPW